jgi:large subunit ribosomal protein L21
MYAVIETGGKQYRVEVGTELEVELLDAEPGKTITLDRVLLVADGDDSTIGQPVVADASVSAEVVSQKRGPKLISFKYRPKARRRVKKGHRQELTLLRVADITLGGKSAAKERKQADDAATAERNARRGGRCRPGREGCGAGREARGRHRDGTEEGFARQGGHDRGEEGGRQRPRRSRRRAGRPCRSR